jgi:hypothetical protein
MEACTTVDTNFGTKKKRKYLKGVKKKKESEKGKKKSLPWTVREFNDL